VPPRLFWHYTTGQKIGPILQSGFLETEDETTGTIPGLPGGVWFSPRQDHEPTALKIVVLPDGSYRPMPFAEQVARVGAWRFGVHEFAPFLVTWSEFSGRCTNRDMVQGLVDAARLKGSDAMEFRVSLRRVEIVECFAVEAFVDGKWLRRWPPVQEERA